MKEKSVLSGLKIGVIGAGHMGQALVKGLVEKSVYPQNVSVFDLDKKKTDAIKKEAHVKIAKSNRHCASLSDVVILAVKPKDLPGVAEEIAGVLGQESRRFKSSPAFWFRAPSNSVAVPSQESRSESKLIKGSESKEFSNVKALAAKRLAA